MTINDFLKIFTSQCAQEMDSEFDKASIVCSPKMPLNVKQRYYIPFAKITNEDLRYYIHSEWIDSQYWINCFILNAKIKFNLTLAAAFFEMNSTQTFSVSNKEDLKRTLCRALSMYKHPMIVVNAFDLMLSDDSGNILDRIVLPKLDLSEYCAFVWSPQILICERADAPYLDFSRRYLQLREIFPENVPMGDKNSMLSYRMRPYTMDSLTGEWHLQDEMMIFNDLTIFASSGTTTKIFLDDRNWKWF